MMETNSFLSFNLGDELFAANVAKVTSILEMQKITKVPKAPDYLKGVINLRGNVLPVIDTRLKFGMEETKVTKNTCILVLEIKIDEEKIAVGALVDFVKEVLEIDEEHTLPPPNIGSKFKSDFIYGVYKNNEDFIMLVDLDKIFSIDELTELQIETQETTTEV